MKHYIPPSSYLPQNMLPHLATTEFRVCNLNVVLTKKWLFYFRLCMLMMRYSCVTAQAWFFLHLSQQKQTWFWMAFYQSTRWETIFLQFLLYLFRLETILSKVNIFHWLVTHPAVQAHVFYFLCEAKQIRNTYGGSFASHDLKTYAQLFFCLINFTVGADSEEISCLSTCSLVVFSHLLAFCQLKLLERWGIIIWKLSML